MKQQQACNEQLKTELAQVNLTLKQFLEVIDCKIQSSDKLQVLLEQAKEQYEFLAKENHELKEHGHTLIQPSSKPGPVDEEVKELTMKLWASQIKVDEMVAYLEQAKEEYKILAKENHELKKRSQPPPSLRVISLWIGS